MSEFENDRNDDLFSKSVRAGKRTYFFDVRSTKNSDYYLTITESKKKFNGTDQKPFYEKHKIFLYKEDFEKFLEGLNEAVTAIRTNNVGAVEPVNVPEPEVETQTSEGTPDSFTDINFEDLK